MNSIEDINLSIKNYNKTKSSEDFQSISKLLLPLTIKMVNLFAIPHPSDKDDLHQTANMSLLKALKKWERNKPFIPFFTKILYNDLVDYKRVTYGKLGGNKYHVISKSIDLNSCIDIYYINRGVENIDLQSCLLNIVSSIFDGDERDIVVDFINSVFGKYRCAHPKRYVKMAVLLNKLKDNLDQETTNAWFDYMDKH